MRREQRLTVPEPLPNRTAPLSEGLRGLLRTTTAEVRARYGRDPAAFAAGSARANLIGEHVDNFGGRRRSCSLPYAIDRQIVVAAVPSEDRVVELTSTNAGSTIRFHLDALSRGDHPLELGSWARFPQAVLRRLAQEYDGIGGFRGVLQGNIEGKGTSSSAALSVALALIASELFHLELSAEAVVEIARDAENATGVACGYMDQMASVFGQAGRVLAVYFRGSKRPEMETIPFDLGPHVLMVFDSGVERDLRTSKYNVRVEESRRALELFADVLERHGRPRPEGIADVTAAALAELGTVEALVAHVRALPAEHPLARLSAEEVARLRRRVTHVVEELARTEEVRTLLERDAEDKMVRIGAILTDCHRSLRDNFEVSLVELDTLVESALHHGALGARLMGAGEGGNVIVLARRIEAERLLEGVLADYRTKHGRATSGFVCTPSAGSRGIPSEVALALGGA